MSNDAGSDRRWLVLAICTMSLLVVVMDTTAVNVALPAIGADLGASISGLQWTLDAYLVTLACFLMLAGATGDRLGRRRVFQVGLGVFGIGSLACSLAPTVGWLIAARVLQALGGAMLNPVALSIITNVFTEPRERARAIGAWGSVVGISLGIGPVLGGVLTDTVGWRAIFWINVPLALAAIALTARYVPESRAAHVRRFDAGGQILVVAVLGPLVAAVIEGPRWGWTSPAVLGLAAVALVALVALVAWERRAPEPLVEMRFFASVPFSAATVIAICSMAAFTGFLFLSALSLQQVRGLSALGSGLALLPAAVTAAVTAPISGRLVGSHGSRPSQVGAGVAMTVAAVVVALSSATTPLWVLLVAYGLFGIGVGAVNPSITNTAVSGMPRAQAGTASAIASTSRQIGQAAGVAVAGTILASAAGTEAGIEAAWWMVAGVSAVFGVVGLVATTARARATTGRVAHLFTDDESPVPARAG